MTQYVINIGAIPNDGTGDPLRTAFNETNLNFNQVFAAGPVLSNVRIANNTVLTTNTNGNLVLATNGTGVIQANVSVVPNLANLRNLGSAQQRWNTVYTQYVDVSGPVSLSQLTVTGNLTVNGNIIQIGNLVTDAKTIQLANTASTANAANGSGITVGANDNIATFLFNSAANAWATNIGLQITSSGNTWRFNNNFMTAPSGATWQSVPSTLDEYITSANNGYIDIQSILAGNTASALHLEHGLAQIIANSGTSQTWTFDSNGNITLPGNTSSINYANGNPYGGSSYGNANVATFLAAFGSNTISTTGNITSNGLVNVNSLRVNQTANAWVIAGNTITAPSGATWNSNAISKDEYITSAVDGYINLTSRYANGNTASQVHLEHGLAQIVVNNGSEYIWAFNSAGQLTVPGNIIPNTSNTYSLGNSTNWWSNIWVAGNTIFIGGVPLGITAGNVLTVNGNAVLQNNSNTAISTTGNITAGNVAVTGGSLAWANAGIVQTSSADFSITGDGQVTVRSLDGTYQWTFGTDGNLAIPGNIIGAATVAIDNRASGNGADIELYSADDILLQARDRSAGSTAEGGDIDIFAGDSAEDSDTSAGDIQIYAGNGGASNVDFGGNGGTITIQTGQGGAASTGVGNYPAQDGGVLTLRAGDAGSNMGNIARGAEGGFVNIEAGDSTGNTINGGGITLTTGQGGANALAGNVGITIPSSDLANGGTWTFDGYGNLTLPSNGDLNIRGGDIVQSAGNDLLITAFDEEGILSSSVELDPNNTLTRVEQWSSQRSSTFTTADWSTGVYTVEAGQGAVVFTNAANIITFVNSLNGVGQIFFSVNAGPQLVWDGTSSGSGNIKFYTPTLPATDPTTVTTFDYYYSYKSGFEIDYDSDEVNIYANDADIRLETTNLRDIVINSDRDLSMSGNGDVTITNYSNVTGVTITANANGTLKQWEFDPDGTTIFPNYTLLNPVDQDFTILVQDADDDGFAILNRITDTDGNVVGQTELQRDRFNINLDMLGSNYQWEFSDFNGTMTLPGNIQGTYGANTSFYAVDDGNNGLVEMKTISYVGDTLGSNIRVTQSNATISTGNAAHTWTFDNTGNLTAPGNISAVGNVTGNYIFGNGSQLTGLPATYGNANVATFLAAYGSNTITTTGNITAGNLIGNISITGNVTGTSPNVTLVAGSYSYVFDNTGTLTLPAAASGNEGGEIAFTQAANSTLGGNTVVLDQYVDRIRFFESGGNTRGAYIDLTQAADGVGTLLNNRVSGIVNAGVFVTMDNLKATVTTSSDRGLSLATVSGTATGYVSSSYSLVVGSPGGAAGSISLTTTPSTSIQGYNFASEGDTAIYVVRDNTSNRVYRITMMIGGSYNNNFISIERLL